MTKTALMIGAGPAGLTAAYEFTKRTAITPIVLEKSQALGGLSRTVVYKNNRIDIGGHRFFSKSDRVMRWWMKVMPVEKTTDTTHSLGYQGQRYMLETADSTPDPVTHDRVLLVRQRRSRIYFIRKFFDYPLKLTTGTLSKLGLVRTARIGISYLRARLAEIRPEMTLEQFLINRFGRELYKTFFKSYTEKVWGVPCNQISAEWGAQRIKGLSLTKAVLHHLRKLVPVGRKDLSQKDTETSLIEKFLYPKLGPGQLWEYVAADVDAAGGEILTGWTVEQIHVDANRVTGITARHMNGELRRFAADYFLSTMPVKELVRAIDQPPPANVREVSEGLIYRDFLTVGLLLDQLELKESSSAGGLLKDNWIYIQEPDVKVGRMQIFNNWSPYLVSDPTKVWVGLEYFCDEGDELWRKPDDEMIAFAKDEMERIGIIRGSNVRDATVIRVEKTYPAYFGTYSRFKEIQDYIDQFENLFLIGRNGMHKYNNQDHSMLTAMTAVDNIIAGVTDKENIWAVNSEMEYHEEKQRRPVGKEPAVAMQ